MPLSSTPRLTTLGGLALALPAGAADSLARQRRKVALLVVLARARRPTSRDTLADMFWGAEPEARARHSLAEALSHLRRALGRSAVPARAAAVALAPGALAVDAAEFEALCERAQWRAAVGAYAGPFLDGVYVDRAPRFEQWVDAERARLARLFERACEAHAAERAAAGDHSGAAAAAARWLEVAPESPAAALALLRAHAAPATDAPRPAASGLALPTSAPQPATTDPAPAPRPYREHPWSVIAVARDNFATLAHRVRAGLVGSRTVLRR